MQEPTKSEFIPTLKLHNGLPVGRTYWGLPITTLPASDCESPVDAICSLIEQNLIALEAGLAEFAKSKALAPSNDGHVTAHCCMQAMETLKELREVVLALIRPDGSD